MDRTSREAIEESDFRDAVVVVVSKTGHSFDKHSLQIYVFCMTVGQINAVLRWTMIGHLVGALDPEGLAGGGAS